MPARSRTLSISSSLAAGRVRAGSAVRRISGFITPMDCNSFRESGSRRVMTSTLAFSTLAASFRCCSRRTGPMPQPYICTLQPAL